MARDEGVADALGGLGEPGDAAEGAQGIHEAGAAGQYFMGVALVTHVEDQAVLREIKNPMEGYGELYGAQIGGQVSPGAGDAVDQRGTEPGAERLGLAIRYGVEVGDIFG